MSIYLNHVYNLLKIKNNNKINVRKTRMCLFEELLNPFYGK